MEGNKKNENNRCEITIVKPGWVLTEFVFLMPCVWPSSLCLASSLLTIFIYQLSLWGTRLIKSTLCFFLDIKSQLIHKEIFS